jgi:hypothetical protein
MRNHVRHSRGERTQPAFAEGHERGWTASAAVRRRSGTRPGRDAVALAPAPAADELLDGAEEFDVEEADSPYRAAGSAGADAENADDVGDTDDLDDADDAEDLDDGADALRMTCPDCGRPIAVLAGGERLPEHAVCPTPWDPFGLTVCAGSGRALAEALPPAVEVLPVARREGADLGTLLALPAGLDWRTQPFSHVGGPGSRPIRLPAPPAPAAHLAA